METGIVYSQEVIPPHMEENSMERDLWDGGVFRMRDFPSDQEVRRTGVSLRSPYRWSVGDFMEAYNEIYSSLNALQLQIKRFPRQLDVTKLSSNLESLGNRIEQFSRHSSVLLEMDTTGKLCWRSDHVTSKWRLVQHMAVSAGTTGPHIQDVCADIELEVVCLRKWLKEVEASIGPVQIRIASEWGVEERASNLRKYKSIHSDIEWHGQMICRLVSVCEEIRGSPGVEMTRALVVVRGLEGRWHKAWLHCLEWQCLLEQLHLHGDGEEEEREGESWSQMESDEELLRTSPNLSLSETVKSKSDTESGDEAYSSLSLSDILQTQDQEDKVRKAKVEDSSDLGSDSGVSEMSGSLNTLRDLTPEPPRNVELNPRSPTRVGTRSRRNRGCENTMSPAETFADKPVSTWDWVRSITIPICVVILVLVLLLWLSEHIRCCDSVCAIYISPILTYTNGPPPL